MIYDRHEFLAKFDINHNLLLIPEREIEPRCTCQFFVCKTPFKWRSSEDKQEFFAWAHAHLEGYIKCFVSSEDQTEWWGFTSYDDAFMFALTWQ